ncbi:MAG: phosphotransferase family protein [Pseudomonadota bacterium]
MNISIATDTAPVRQGEEMDWPALSSWLKRNIPDLDGQIHVAQFHGGHANLTYCISFGEQEMVVRRPPQGLIAPGAHDMAREYRVLSALAPHFDRAPRVLAYCADVEIIGAPFIVMERCRGEIIRDCIPPGFAATTTIEHDISFAIIDAMVALQTIDTDLFGFANYERARGFVSRQLSGWHQRWQLVSDVASHSIFEAVFDKLRRMQPETKRVTIVHNDLKLDNCIFDPARPTRVQTILDWDMTTLGDPRIEFGTLLGYWKQVDDRIDRAPTIGLDMTNFPTRAEIVSYYASKGGLVDQLNWFEAFALWKHAVVLRQLYTRYERGESQDERYANFPAHVHHLIDGAAQILLA